MGIFLGDAGAIGFGSETVVGTPVAASGTKLSTKAGAAAGKKGGLLDTAEALGFASQKLRERGKWAGGGGAGLLNYAGDATSGYGQLLEHCFGNVTGTTTLAYAVDDDTPSLRSLTQHKDMGGRTDAVQGWHCFMIEWLIEAGFSGFAFDGIGMDVAHGSALALAKEAKGTLAHSNDVDVFTIGGVDYLSALMSSKVKMEMGYTAEERLFLGSDSIGAPQRKGPRKFSAEFLIELRDAAPDVTTLVTAWEANTPLGAIVLGMNNGTEDMQWDLSDVICVTEPSAVNPGATTFLVKVEAEDLAHTRLH